MQRKIKIISVTTKGKTAFNNLLHKEIMKPLTNIKVNRKEEGFEYIGTKEDIKELIRRMNILINEE